MRIAMGARPSAGRRLSAAGELAVGTSGPQVIEGFHGVPFDAPIGRAREVIEVRPTGCEPTVRSGGRNRSQSTVTATVSCCGGVASMP